MATVIRGTGSTSVGDVPIGWVGMGVAVLGIGAAVLATGVAVLVIGLLVFVAVLVPGLAAAVQLYAGVMGAPALSGAEGWAGVAMDVVWGAVLGMLVGLVRLRWRRPFIEELLGFVVSPQMVSAARTGAWTVAIHALLGALSGVVAGLLGLISPADLAAGLGGAVHALPAVALLTGGGFFNGGGAPPDGGYLFILLLLLVFLVVAWTTLLAAVIVPLLAWVAGVLVSGAAQGAGQAAGGALLVAATGALANRERRDEILYGGRYPGGENEGKRVLAHVRRGWFRAALAAGVRTGMVVGLVNGCVAVAFLHLARGRIVAAAGPLPSLYAKADLGVEGQGVMRHPDGRALVAAGVLVPCQAQPGFRDCWEVERAGEVHALGDSVRAESSGSRIELRHGPTGRFRTLAGHHAAIQALALSPDGRLLASADADRVVRLWDVRTGRGLAAVQDAGLFLKAIAFSPDGSLLVSGNYEVRVWSVR